LYLQVPNANLLHLAPNLHYSSIVLLKGGGGKL